MDAETGKIVHRFCTIYKCRLLGSASVRGLIYPSDIDIEVSTKKQSRAKTLAKHLQDYVRSLPENVIVEEFKAGFDSDGEPLRWQKEDVLKGKIKLSSGKFKSLEKCLLDDTIIKLDLLIDSNNSWIDVGMVVQFNKKETNDDIAKALEDDIDKYKTSESLKALKRFYSVLKFEPTKNKKQIDKLTEFFNGIVGFVNKQRAELGILLKLLKHRTWSQLLPFTKQIRLALKRVFSKVKLNNKADIEHTIEKLRVWINNHSKEMLRSLL